MLDDGTDSFKGHTVYPEPPGYDCLPEFVKSNPKNNEVYIEMFVENLDEGVANLIRDAHQRIKELSPGYNISQLKEKFGELRYYYTTPEETSWEVDEQIARIVSDTEKKVTEQWQKITQKH